MTPAPILFQKASSRTIAEIVAPFLPSFPLSAEMAGRVVQLAGSVVTSAQVPNYRTTELPKNLPKHSQDRSRIAGATRTIRFPGKAHCVRLIRFKVVPKLTGAHFQRFFCFEKGVESLPTELSNYRSAYRNRARIDPELLAPHENDVSWDSSIRKT